MIAPGFRVSQTYYPPRQSDSKSDYGHSDSRSETGVPPGGGSAFGCENAGLASRSCSRARAVAYQQLKAVRDEAGGGNAVTVAGSRGVPSRVNEAALTSAHFGSAISAASSLRTRSTSGLALGSGFDRSPR